MSKNEKILATADLTRAILMLERKNADQSWESLNKHKEMQAYRRPYSKNKDYYEYLALGEMDLSPELMLATNLDVEYRNSWDSYSKALKKIKDLPEEATDLLYWRVCYPFPFTDRDYLYVRYSLKLTAQEVLEHLESETEKEEFKTLIKNDLTKTYHITSSVPSLDHDPKDDPGAKSGIIRVKEFHSICVITSVNGDEKAKNSKSLLYTYLFDNPGGNIPSTLINWVAKTAMPKTLDLTKKAGEKYNKWKSSQK